MGTVGDGWGRLGTVGDGWGRLGTVGDGWGTGTVRDGDGDPARIGTFTVFQSRYFNIKKKGLPILKNDPS
jgi:hypothetical protein